MQDNNVIITSPKPEGATKKQSKKPLIAILLFLSLTIVGLTGAIVVVSVKHNNNDNQNINQELSPEDRQEILATIREDAKEIETEDIETYYDNKASEYIGSDLEPFIQFEKLNYLIEQERFEDALLFGEQIDTGRLQEDNKMAYYYAMMQIAKKLGDEEKAAAFDQLYMQSYETLFEEEDAQ